MTDEKKKPEEDEVSEEQLKDVAGGIIDIRTVKKTTLPLDKNIPDLEQPDGIAGSGGEDR